MLGVSKQILAFYYGWYGTPSVSGRWVHWTNVDAAAERIGDTAHYPAFGPYDSHDQAMLRKQVAQARAAGITGFIATWWGRGTFDDQGIPLLLSAAAGTGFVVSAHYETVTGKTPESRMIAAVTDLDYILQRYAGDKAWLRALGKPVVFVYDRAATQLTPAQWASVLAKVRRDNPGGVIVVADTLEPAYISVFDGAALYNVTGNTWHKPPGEVSYWAHGAYPKVAAVAGAGRISTATVIPGYDDRELGKPPPRPVTDRWGGEIYRALWTAAVAANPDYVLITSWNEWHEGTEIEPSVEYGSSFLEMTAPFARQFLGAAK